MLPIRVEGATRYLSKPRDWRDEECGSLAIRDDRTSTGHIMTSAWEPTPEEIAAINQGAPITLLVWGTMHPPVALSVGKVPE